VQVKKLVEEEEEGMISNKKPTKAMLGRDKLYGCFVKVQEKQIQMEHTHICANECP
jgi:hypothetical protein